VLALLLRPETVLSPRVMKHGIDRNVWLKKPGIKNPMYTDTPSVTERSTGGGGRSPRELWEGRGVVGNPGTETKG